MTFKKLTTLAMATVVSASLLVGCSSSNESATDDKITVAMITDVAGVNDQSFNQSAWEGLQKAEKELGWKAEKGIDEMCADSYRWQSQNPNGYED